MRAVSLRYNPSRYDLYQSMLFKLSLQFNYCENPPPNPIIIVSAYFYGRIQSPATITKYDIGWFYFN